MNRERLFSYPWYPVRRVFSHPGLVTFQRSTFGRRALWDSWERREVGLTGTEDTLMEVQLRRSWK